MTTIADMHSIAGNTKHAERKAGFLNCLGRIGGKLLPPHILAQVLAQVMHESGRFQYVREVWGPTTAQLRYEGRKSLGNVIAGDGRRFMGRDLIQTTGRANYRALTAWVKACDPAAPDFEQTPEALEQPEWLGVSVVWYFTTRPKLMAACEAGDVVRVSEIVNGGHNGLSDRLDLYTRAALVLLGYAATDIRGFQAAKGLAVDGAAGTVTRAALHHALVALSRVAPAAAPEPTPARPNWLASIIIAIFGGRA